MKRLTLLLLLVSCGGVEESPPPTAPAELHAWLRASEYASWAAESVAWPGLNGTRRRVFVNELADPDGSPVGAAAVRELWRADQDVLLGWSVLVKTESGWWFFETFDTSEAGSFAVAEFDAPGCLGCHAAAPDTLRSSFPLR